MCIALVIAVALFGSAARSAALTDGATGPSPLAPLSALEAELGLAPEELANVSLGHAMLNADEFQRAAKTYLGDMLPPERQVALVDGPARGLARLAEAAIPTRNSARDFGPAPADAAAPSLTDGLGPQGAQAPRARQTPRQERASRVTELLKLYLNARPEQGGGAARLDSTPDLRQQGSDNSSVALDTLKTAIDIGGPNMVAEIFAPALEANGYISLSLGGLARFVFVVSQESNTLRIVDADTGRSITVAAPESAGGGSGGIGGSARSGGLDDGLPRRTSAPAENLTFAGLVEMVVDSLGSLATQPGFAASVAIVGVLWLLWRLRRRRIEI